MKEYTDNYSEMFDDEDYIATHDNVAYIMELEDTVSRLTEENNKLKSDYLYVRADMDNMKKRHIKQIDDMKQTACVDTVKSLMDSIIELWRARNYDEGINLIYNKFINSLNKIGVEIITPEPGTVFDVNKMNALSLYPVNDKNMDNTIFDVAEPGFKIGNTVIKYANVLVNSYQE